MGHWLSRYLGETGLGNVCEKRAGVAKKKRRWIQSMELAPGGQLEWEPFSRELGTSHGEQYKDHQKRSKKNEKRQSNLVYFTVSAGDSSKTNDGPLNKSAFKF